MYEKKSFRLGNSLQNTFKKNLCYEWTLLYVSKHVRTVSLALRCLGRSRGRVSEVVVTKRRLRVHSPSLQWHDTALPGNRGRLSGGGSVGRGWTREASCGASGFHWPQIWRFWIQFFFFYLLLKWQLMCSSSRLCELRNSQLYRWQGEMISM